MKSGAPGTFGAQLKALREAAGFTQEELATIAGLSVHAVSALERGERRRPHVDTVRALSAALDLKTATRDALIGSARPAAPGDIDEAPSSTLPLPLTGFLGRDDDVQLLRHWLADLSARLITLVGPGGVGKTRLALEIARGMMADRSRRVVFVPLSTMLTPAFVASAIAEAFGLSDVSVLELPRRTRVACQDQPTLLVLDNFEHVLDATPLVVDLLTAVPTLQLLITSRAALRVRGEKEFVVGPLALDPGTNVASSETARPPALRLFVERVRDVRPDFRLTPTNDATVTAICRRLDALPLALELAAPWMKVLTIEDLLRRLERDVLIPLVSPRDLPERQQTMNATVAWSYKLLDPTEQRAFRRFGALPGLFPIDAAAAVLAGADTDSDRTEEALAAAASLIDKSLLLRPQQSVVSTCALYRMLETVRAYALVELTTSGERDDAMEGLVHYCRDEASMAAEGLIGPAQVEWLDRVREDLESYRAVLTWLIDHGPAAEAASIAWDLKYFWLIRGHAIEGLRWYEQILAVPSLPPAAESRALLGAAQMWWTQGEIVRARAGLVRVLALGGSVGETAIVAQAEHISGHIEHALGNMDAAEDLFGRSLEKFRALSIPSGIATVLSGMAVLALAKGDVSHAERLLEEATSIARHAGPWFLTWALYVRATLAVRHGDPDDAIALMAESLTRIRELHDNFAFVYALVPLIAAAVLKGDDAWAALLVGARDSVTDRTGVTVVDKSARDLQDQSEMKARRRLGPARWSETYETGRRTSIESLASDLERRFATA